MPGTSPLEGQILWVNHAPSQTDPTPLLQRLAACKATGVLLKYHDGMTVADNTGWHLQGTFRRLAPVLKRAGYSVWAWGYWYQDDKPSTMAGIVRQAATDGAEGYVADAEAEFETANGAAVAAPILKAIRGSNPGLPLGYTTFAEADVHPKFPYKTFDAACDVALPQVYWGMFGTPVDQAYNHCYFSMEAAGVAGANAHARWQPVGQSAGNVTAAQVSRFAILCRTGALPSVSWWVLDKQAAAMDATLANTPYAQAVVPPKA